MSFVKLSDGIIRSPGRMQIYFDILRFSFLRFFSYPYEILATALRTVVEISFLIFFWSLFTRSATHSMGVVGFASYFLIASGVNDLVMAQWGKFGAGLGDAIKSGTINNYLIKPINILPTFYFTALGKNGVNKVLSVITITIGLLIQPPQSLMAILLFIIFFINASMIAYAYNILDATMFFHSPDAKGMRNAINHMIGIFSGLLIPISLFPEPFKSMLKLTPFPWMVFGPVNALRTNFITQQTMLDITIVIFWSMALNIIAQLFWAWSIKKYEAIGI